MLLDLKQEEDRLTIWNKAKAIDGFDPNKYRQDACGAWMAYDRYGDCDNIFGWEIDHIYPKAKKGTDEELNLRAMHWRNNRSKGDDYPHYTSVVTSDGNMNIEKETSFTVNEEKQKELSDIFLI